MTVDPSCSPVNKNWYKSLYWRNFLSKKYCWSFWGCWKEVRSHAELRVCWYVHEGLAYMYLGTCTYLKLRSRSKLYDTDPPLKLNFKEVCSTQFWPRTYLELCARTIEFYKPCLHVVRAGRLGWIPWTYPDLVSLPPNFFLIKKFFLLGYFVTDVVGFADIKSPDFEECPEFR